MGLPVLNYLCFLQPGISFLSPRCTLSLVFVWHSLHNPTGMGLPLSGTQRIHCHPNNLPTYLCLLWGPYFEMLQQWAVLKLPLNRTLENRLKGNLYSYSCCLSYSMSSQSRSNSDIFPSKNSVFPLLWQPLLSLGSICCVDAAFSEPTCPSVRVAGRPHHLMRAGET